MSRRHCRAGHKKALQGRAKKHEKLMNLVLMASAWAVLTVPTSIYLYIRLASGSHAHVPMIVVTASLVLLAGTVLAAVVWWRG